MHAVGPCWWGTLGLPIKAPGQALQEYVLWTKMFWPGMGIEPTIFRVQGKGVIYSMLFFSLTKTM